MKNRHPLFPLLALLLEKCEEATRGELDTRVVLTGLENDVRAFIQQEKDGNKNLVTDDAEVDGLVMNSDLLLCLMCHTNICFYFYRCLKHSRFFESIY